VQDQYSFFWSEDQINKTLEETIKTAFNSVRAMSERYNTDMRTSAYILAVGRVVEATSVRGIFP
jgi:glutamate dehydrogenase (NAD(P)+)